jgi:hypothetical protein
MVVRVVEVRGASFLVLAMNFPYLEPQLKTVDFITSYP